MKINKKLLLLSVFLCLVFIVTPVFAATTNESVISELNFNGTHASSTIVDNNASNIWSAGILGKLNANIKKYGSSSAWYTSESGSVFYLPVVGSAFETGHNTFTVSMWLYRNGSQAYPGRIYEQQMSSNGIGIYWEDTNKISVGLTTYPAITTTDAIPDQTWVFLRLVRSENDVTKLYINGVQTGSTYTTDYLIANPTTINVGSYSDASVYGHIGNIDDFQFSKAALDGTEVPGELVNSGTAPSAAFNCTPVSGSRPLSISCFDNSSGESPISWYWMFGDGNTSALQNPTKSYDFTGVFTINFSASNSGGTTWSNRTDLINVTHPLPIDTDFSCTPTSGNRPLSTTCTDSSTGSPSVWEWDFGDGNTSTTQNPGKTYSYAGLFTVILKASDYYWGNNTETKNNYINVTWPLGLSSTLLAVNDFHTLLTSCDGIRLEWTNPLSAEYNGSMIYVDGVHVGNVTNATTHYTTIAMAVPMIHTFSAYSFNFTGQINSTPVTTSSTLSCGAATTQTQKIIRPTETNYLPIILLGIVIVILFIMYMMKRRY